MSEMVERVAKALHALGHGPWPEPACTRCMDAARVAIEAMREPTEAMVYAADVALQGDFLPPDSTWEKMIDAALLA